MKNEIKIPNHLAIILDGNGRWAKKRGFARTYGHKIGTDTLREIIQATFDVGVKVLSVYAFSTENWKRPQEEIDYLFSLVQTTFEQHVDYFVSKDVRVLISGDYSKLPENTRIVCEQVISKTKDCKRGTFNICLNYGSHDEIIRACKNIALDVKKGSITVESIDASLFESYLYTKDLPPIDFLIRTSNEKRLSNFMLYQASYAELYFTKTYWPAFHKNQLMKAFKEYAKRDRRYGGIKK